MMLVCEYSSNSGSKKFDREIELLLAVRKQVEDRTKQ